LLGRTRLGAVQEARSLQHAAHEHLDAVCIARGRADIVEGEVAFDVRAVRKRSAVGARAEGLHEGSRAGALVGIGRARGEHRELRGVGRDGGRDPLRRLPVGFEIDLRDVPLDEPEPGVIGICEEGVDLRIGADEIVQRVQILFVRQKLERRRPRIDGSRGAREWIRSAARATGAHPRAAARRARATGRRAGARCTWIGAIHTTHLRDLADTACGERNCARCGCDPSGVNGILA
jgi:hypothetical protein